MKKSVPYDRRYSAEEYYWGKKPSTLCNKITEIIQPGPNFHPKLVDVGCGEGRNAVYFAKHGFEVVGLDISLAGLEKTRKFAVEEGVRVKTIHADVNKYRLTETYDVIFSTGTLHYLPPELREETLRNYKNHTSQDGFNAFSVLVEKPFIAKAPDFDAEVSLFKSGEVMGYYWDWEILYCIEEIFDCMSSGIPHKHAVNRIVARRNQGRK